ncbi:hypothetical protein [Brevibacillus brevis]|uniref:hypothetical protein n=1 Tax=Brevibacillus brevis TaxID=1393 RepID=UPI0025A54595|nr:hypothetical protein [Brevibacillus brevis]WJQ80162.1 hypothetical protein QN310_22235 [Brevibacillus brevis]
MKKTKSKLGSFLSVSALSALAVTAVFPVIPAQAAMNGNKDGIVAQVKKVEKADSKKQQNDEEDKKGKKGKKEDIKLTPEQEAIYIQKAKDAFQEKNIELPASGYKIEAYHFMKETETVYVSWFPEDEDEDEAKKPMKVYRAKFENADLDKGTGSVSVKVINQFGTVFSKLDQELAAPFIEKAKEALQEKNIDLPETGYEAKGVKVTTDDVLRSVEVSFLPEGTDGRSGKVYYVHFVDVDLDKGTGKVFKSFVREHKEQQDDEDDKKDKKADSKLTAEQEANYIQKAKDAFQEKNIELPASGYKINTDFSSKNSNTVIVIWLPEDKEKVRTMKVYLAEFKNADLDKGTGTVDVKVINKFGTVIGKLDQELAAPFIEKAKEALKEKNIELPETGYEIKAVTFTTNDVLRSVEVSFVPEGTNGRSGKVYEVSFRDVDVDKGTGTLYDVFVDDNDDE